MAKLTFYEIINHIAKTKDEGVQFHPIAGTDAEINKQSEPVLSR